MGGVGDEITDGSVFAAPSVADVVFNTLQTDSRWSVDSTGYNVLVRVATPSESWGQHFDLHVTLSLASGDTVVLVQRLDSK